MSLKTTPKLTTNVTTTAELRATLARLLGRQHICCYVTKQLCMNGRNTNDASSDTVKNGVGRINEAVC